MSATIIRVDFSQMRNVASAFEEDGEAVKRFHDDLEQYVESLRSKGWQAPAAAKFYQDLDQKLLPSVNELSKALHSSKQAMDKIMEIMASHDETASMLVKQALAAQIGLMLGAAGAFVADALKSANWKQILENGVDLLEHNDFFKPASDALAKQILESGSNLWADIVANNGDDLAKLTSKFRLLENAGVNKFIKEFAAPGIVDGLLDYGVGVITGEHAWNDMGALGTQVGSGLVQAGIGMIPVVGPAIIVGDLAVQTTLTVTEFIAEPIANALGYDGDAVGDAINNFRENVSLDHWVDKGVEVVGEFAGDAINEMGNFFGL